jgi:hypothetical protein
VCVEASAGYHGRVIREYFAARLAEIDEELVELGPEGRFETVSAKTHSVVTTGTLGEILGAGDSNELTAQAETNWYGASDECGIDAIPTALRDALAETTDLLRVAERWTATDELQLSGWTWMKRARFSVGSRNWPRMRGHPAANSGSTGLSKRRTAPSCGIPHAGASDYLTPSREANPAGT